MARKRKASEMSSISIVPFIRSNRLYGVKVSGRKFPINRIINIQIYLVDQLNSTKYPFFTIPLGNMNFNTDGIGSFSARYSMLYDQVYENHEYNSLIIDEFLLVEVKTGRKLVSGILKDIYRYNPYNVNNG